MNPLHTTKSTTTVPVVNASPPHSPRLSRAPMSSVLPSSVSEGSLHALDGFVKRLSGRITSFGSLTEEPTSGQTVNDAITQLRIDTLLVQSVDIARELLLPINGFPFTAHRFTTMDQLYVLFEMVKVQCVFVVTNSNKLEGMISKSLLMQRLKKKNSIVPVYNSLYHNMISYCI